jgi:hypothetical protein
LARLSRRKRDKSAVEWLGGLVSGIARKTPGRIL